MQISTLPPSSSNAAGINTGSVEDNVKAAETPASSAAAAPTDEAAASKASNTGTASNAAPLQRGVSQYDDRLQSEIASAQQSLDFLDQSASQLQALKSELAAKLAARSAGREGQVEARVRQFSKTWNSRQNASAGALDAQLNYSSPQPAAQSFTVRGLNMANLQNGPREVLTFAVATASQNLSSVTIDAGMTEEEIANRLDQALAPAKIRVSSGQDGVLVFNTPEKSWPAVRDSLAVRGSGIRFPTGQMSQVTTDTEQPVIAPEGWGTSDTEALRQTLQNVVNALARVQQSRAAVSQALAGASTRVDSAQTVSQGIGMDRLAENFSSTASGAGYGELLSISSALVGISRERVVSLLSL